MSRFSRAALPLLSVVLLTVAAPQSAHADWTDYFKKKEEPAAAPAPAPAATAAPSTAVPVGTTLVNPFAIGTTHVGVGVGTGKATNVMPAAAKPVISPPPSEPIKPAVIDKAAEEKAAAAKAAADEKAAEEKAAAEKAAAAKVEAERKAAIEAANKLPPVPVTLPTGIPAGVLAEKVSTSSLSSKGTLDVYMTLTNHRPELDAISDVEAPAGRVVLVKGGSEGPVQLGVGTVPVKLDSDTQFIRLYDLDKNLKPGSHFTLTFHCRRGPNVNVDVTIAKGSSLFGN